MAPISAFDKAARKLRVVIQERDRLERILANAQRDVKAAEADLLAINATDDYFHHQDTDSPADQKSVLTENSVNIDPFLGEPGQNIANIATSDYRVGLDGWPVKIPTDSDAITKRPDGPSVRAAGVARVRRDGAVCPECDSDEVEAVTSQRGVYDLCRRCGWTWNEASAEEPRARVVGRYCRACGHDPVEGTCPQCGALWPSESSPAVTLDPSWSQRAARPLVAPVSEDPGGPWRCPCGPRGGAWPSEEAAVREHARHVEDGSAGLDPVLPFADHDYTVERQTPLSGLWSWWCEDCQHSGVYLMSADAAHREHSAHAARVARHGSLTRWQDTAAEESQ